MVYLILIHGIIFIKRNKKQDVFLFLVVEMMISRSRSKGPIVKSEKMKMKVDRTVTACLRAGERWTETDEGG